LKHPLRIAALLFVTLQLSVLLCALPQIPPSDANSTYSAPVWKETPVIRIVMRSTADWARIMFDDTNGTNTNGIRFKKIGDYGWLIRHDDDDAIDVGVDETWFDILYGGEVVSKTGDIVAFFKGENDFEYTEMYADIAFEVDMSRSQIYLFLMIAGKGTTTFEMYVKSSNTLIWKDSFSGDGRTQHIKRYIPAQIFFQTSTVGSVTVISMTLITILIIVGLNLPRIRNRH